MTDRPRRSNTTISIPLPRTYTCAYCRIQGHSYVHCTHPSIERLKTRLNNVYVMNKMFLTENYYIYWHLYKLLPSELTMILHQHKLITRRTNLKTKDERIQRLLDTVYKFGLTTEESTSSIEDYITMDMFIRYRQLDARDIRTMMGEMCMIWPTIADDVRAMYTKLSEYTPSPILVAELPADKTPQTTYLSVTHPTPLSTDCSICLSDLMTDYTVLNCSHAFCSKCILRHIYHQWLTVPQCPNCRSTILSVQCSEQSTYSHIHTQFHTFITSQDEQRVLLKLESMRTSADPVPAQPDVKTRLKTVLYMAYIMYMYISIIFVLAILFQRTNPHSLLII
jgi:hypothetical protein